MARPPADWNPHIGRKVSLRYVLRDPSGGHTELVGVLQRVGANEAGEAAITVLDRRGERHEVRQADIVAAKVM